MKGFCNVTERMHNFDEMATINAIVELILTLGFHKISTRYLEFSALQDVKRYKTMLPAAKVGHGMKRSFG